jgi:hypothetical protein
LYIIGIKLLGIGINMTEEERLNVVLIEAFKRGWISPFGGYNSYIMEEKGNIDSACWFSFICANVDEACSRIYNSIGIGILFNPFFAKAFWGEVQIPIMDMDDTIPAWQYHLSKMVLEEEPLKYIEKFL